MFDVLNIKFKEVMQSLLFNVMKFNFIKKKKFPSRFVIYNTWTNYDKKHSVRKQNINLSSM